MWGIKDGSPVRVYPQQLFLPKRGRKLVQLSGKENLTTLGVISDIVVKKGDKLVTYNLNDLKFDFPVSMELLQLYHIKNMKICRVSKKTMEIGKPFGVEAILFSNDLVFNVKTNDHLRKFNIAIKAKFIITSRVKLQEIISVAFDVRPTTKKSQDGLFDIFYNSKKRKLNKYSVFLNTIAEAIDHVMSHNGLVLPFGRDFYSLNNGYMNLLLLNAKENGKDL